MTKQEAIEILRDTPIDIRSTREDDIHTLYATAQGMAIEALSCSEKPNRSEPLTDKEQRIFLAAMDRERKVCKQVDEEWRDYLREPYEDSLVQVCNEIERKVKGVLWTTV